MRVDLVVENPESYKSGFRATAMPVIVEYERRFAEDRRDCYWLCAVTGYESENRGKNVFVKSARVRY